jgi:hypothetical protein
MMVAEFQRGPFWWVGTGEWSEGVPTVINTAADNEDVGLVFIDDVEFWVALGWLLHSGQVQAMRRAWHRSRVWIRKMCPGSVSEETSATYPSSTTRLPLEYVEMITAHLFYDTHNLACYLTCYSWYIAAVPHLHHTLITPACFTHENELPWWPDSFRATHKFGLFPSARKFLGRGCIRDSSPAEPPSFSPKLFGRHILHQFSAPTNVRELRVD